jgi:hypothetical protein
MMHTVCYAKIPRDSNRRVDLITNLGMLLPLVYTSSESPPMLKIDCSDVFEAVKCSGFHDRTRRLGGASDRDRVIVMCGNQREKEDDSDRANQHHR